MYTKPLLFAFSIMIGCSNAYAIKVEGSFTAIKSCPAYQSFKKGTNPGDVLTIPGMRYEIVEENKADGPWALVLMPEENIDRRWVAKECGLVSIQSRDNGKPESDDDTPQPGNNCSIQNSFDSYLLALSWQAGFCEHYSYSGSKPECDNLNSGKISLTNLTIHGLWPNKASCGTNYGSCSNTPLDLEPDTIAKIAPWMPNWYYTDDFGMHEWIKHGTCQQLADDEYFLLIQELVEKFDGSALGEYMRANIGAKVSVSDMKAYLIENLGGDVASKIELRCVGNGKRYLSEFWINLPQDIHETGTLGELVSGAQDKPKFSGNCPEQIYIEAPGPN